MSFDPRSDYARQDNGQADGRFENARRRYIHPLVTMVSVDEVGEIIGFPTSANVILEATKPDERLSLELVIAYRPKDGDTSVDVDTLLADGRTYGVNLTDATIWLALLANVGGSDIEVEDIIGTRASPEQMISEGNQGVTYEVDLDAAGVRAHLVLPSPNCLGHWVAFAKWTADEEMSQPDWEHARQNMRLHCFPRDVQRIEVYRAPEGGPT
jgi:hypothetical protein